MPVVMEAAKSRDLPSASWGDPGELLVWFSPSLKVFALGTNEDGSLRPETEKQ